MSLKMDKETLSAGELGKRWKEIRLPAQKWVLGLGLAGIALLVSAGLFGTDAVNSKKQADSSANIQAAEYEKALENRLSVLLKHVAGAGEVSVMITLENTEQTVYAQAEQSTSDAAQDADSAVSRRSSYTNDVVLLEGEDGEQALEETTVQPTIKGVAVVCSGAGDIRVVTRITELVSTVLGITTNRICVTN